jgi:serine protease AprX
LSPRKRHRRSSRVSNRALTHTETEPRGTRGFLPEVLDHTVIAIPLLRDLDQKPEGSVFDVVIDVNLNFAGGRKAACARVQEMIGKLAPGRQTDQRPHRDDPELKSEQYVFASLDADTIRALVRMDSQAGKAPRTQRAIYHIWPDFHLKRLVNKSISTVKANAAHNAFAAYGDDIIWAVIDSGIDGNHPHFDKHKNLEGLPAAVKHRDFTSVNEAPLIDRFGHGTHVAGIIAGQMTGGRIIATMSHLDERGRPTDVTTKLPLISGMAPRAKLLSLKVLDQDGRGNGTGKASSIISALEYIQKLNGDGRRILVQGVNLSVGYDFQPEWFACGQSPLCIEVNRLVKSGVVVVVAAGNSGYGFVESTTADTSRVAAGLDLTINDPGNADLAITVGSTHRDMPHVYGVSYFSSKGPTGDGRMKPDLLAPGEKIISCDSSQRGTAGRRTGRRARANTRRRAAAVGRYREDSGTSMAAPHVSGVIAAFLSIRREFIGRPEEVKQIFLSTATDLQRAHYFQGRGLVDLMRAIQSI